MFQVKYLSPLTSLCIIRCARPALSTVWGAITFIRSIKGVPICPRVIHVGGTIRKTQQAAIRLDRELILAMKENEGEDEALDIGTLRELEKSQKLLGALEP